ncbi:hypothetical protein DICA3_F09846 [Diutina catenulata]
MVTVSEYEKCGTSPVMTKPKSFVAFDAPSLDQRIDPQFINVMGAESPDMPSLVSDHDFSDDDTASLLSVRTNHELRRRPSRLNPSTPTPRSPGSPAPSPRRAPSHPSPRTAFAQLHTQINPPNKLLPEQLRFQRQKLMAILVKYIATKIYNSFPPESPKVGAKPELPLDKFLLILVSRLRLTLPVFMKGVIYLFRYMDIIYLLRYLNQSNNFANYCAMDFELKQLIVGCFNLAVTREKQLIKLKSEKVGRAIPDPYQFDWARVTGMTPAQINTTVATIVTRMNGKLMIKNVELVKLRSEMLRFVKMVAKVQ